MIEFRDATITNPTMFRANRFPNETSRADFSDVKRVVRDPFNDELKRKEKEILFRKFSRKNLLEKIRLDRFE